MCVGFEYLKAFSDASASVDHSLPVFRVSNSMVFERVESAQQESCLLFCPFLSLVSVVEDTDIRASHILLLKEVLVSRE